MPTPRVLRSGPDLLSVEVAGRPRPVMPLVAIADSSDELLEPLTVAQALGFEGTVDILDRPVHPRGFRLLRRIPRLPATVVEKVVRQFGRLDAIMDADIEDLDGVDGVGTRRAEAIQDGLRRLREQSMLEGINV